MRTSKLILMTLIGLLILVVLVVAALFLKDPAVFRSQLEARAAAALGRQVQFDGPIRLERSLRPRIIIEDITIGNPDWASGAHFAEAEKIGVQVALLPLLRGELRILDVSFTGVDLFIEEGPDGTNNYIFGDRGDSEGPGVLPPVEQLLLRDIVIHYQSADADISSYKIAEARLWNIPGEPERIEGEGSAKGMPFTILLVADSAAELSGPQNPWSLKLELLGSDMSLIFAGRMAQAFKWDKGDYRITISGKQADALETLFGVESPTTGPFELSWNLNVAEGSYRLTDLFAQVHGPSGTPDFKVSNGEASGGQDVPLRIGLQGQYGAAPFSFMFASANTFEGIWQTTPWPIEAQLSIADTKLKIDGTMIPATAAERFELDASLQGETLDTLAQLVGTDLPKAGPYQISFRTQGAEGGYTLTDLEGTFNGIELWKTVRIVSGEASGLENGSVKASINVKLDDVPLLLSFQGGPGAFNKAGDTIWPVELEASAYEAELKGQGSVVTGENGKVVQITTRINGERFESFGPLFGISLPAMGKFNLSADVSSGNDVHEASSIKVELGSNRITGNLQWEDKAPRPFLTGKLYFDRLALDKLLYTGPAPSSGTGKAGPLDRPLKLDGLKVVDAKLNLAVNRITNTPLPVTDVKAEMKIMNGNLSAAYRTKVADTPMDGQIQVSQRKDMPGVSLKAKNSRIDIGQTLKQLEIPNKIVGTVDAVYLDGSSTGRTLRELYEQAAFSLQVKPANLSYTANVVDQTIDVRVESAELAVRRGHPVTAGFTGTLRGVPFNATVRLGSLVEMQRANASLPVRVNLQTPDVQFKTEGTVAKTLKYNQFDLKYELTGKEIQGLDPLADFTVPLRGAFSAQGRITARGHRFTLEKDLRIGKSDLKANITVLRTPNRPKITGSLFARELHLDDVRRLEADEDTGPVAVRSRVIPDYTIPVDALLAANLDLDIKAARIRTQLGDIGELASKVSLKRGRFKSSLNVEGVKGARLSSEFDLNAGIKPPMIKIRINAKDLNYGLWLQNLDVTNLLEGQIDLRVDLTGSGASQYSFFGDADGRITVIGGPGRISVPRIDLWAADLIPTMLSTRWQREDVTETNCFVAHIRLDEGLAEIEDLLLDTRRIIIAASGRLDLEKEKLDVIIAPRPKRASLVSIANPVRVGGTLSEPEVAVTRLPRGRRLAGAGLGLLAGLVNPAFLIFSLSDTGTGMANPCDAAVERAQDAIKAGSQ